MWILLACGPGEVEPAVWDGPCCDGTPIVHGDTLVGWGFVTDEQNTVGLGFFDASPAGPVVGRQSLAGHLQGAPALGADELVLIALDDLHAVSAAAPLWSRPLPGMATTAVSLGPNGDLYVGTDADAVFHFDRNGTELSSTGLSRAPIGRIAVAADGSAYGFASAEGWALYGIEPDGALRYSEPTDIPLVQPSLMGDGALVAVVYRGSTESLELGPDLGLVELVAWEAATGEERWARPLGDGSSTAVETEEGEIVVALSDELVAFDASGQELWRSEQIPSLGEPTVGDDGHFYVGCEGGLCVFDERGKLEESYELAGGTVALPPALHGAHIIVNSTRFLVGIPIQHDVRPARTWSRAGADNRGTGHRSSP